MRHIFVINPLAGKGKPLKLIPVINRIFETRPDDEAIIRIVEGPGHAVSIVHDYADYAKGSDCRIYSVGGDGTLNVVLNGIMKAGINDCVMLSTIPAGSGNDFIKSLSEEIALNGFGSKAVGTAADSLENVLERTVNGIEMVIDAARVNDDYYINIASLGFDGEVAHTTNMLKKLPLVTGQFAYVLGVFLTLAKCTRHSFKIRLDGKSMDSEVLLVAAANGRYYGGGMKAAPDASCTDGQLEICLVTRVGRMRIISLLPKFIKGLHGNLKEVSFHKGRLMEIECASETPMNIDGEVKLTKNAVFEILPASVRFMVPSPPTHPFAS